MRRSFWVETLGCPKNQVDSEKVTGLLESRGLEAAPAAEAADVVVVNTCAFIEEARAESVETILQLAGQRRDGAELVVAGCLAQRSGDELAEALPEVDRVVGFGGDLLGDRPEVPAFDLLRLPRPRARAPWAYVKVAEGCDRACGFCAIPSFRGPQRSRAAGELLEEVEQLGVREVVLVAQDLAAYGRDQGRGGRAIVPLLARVAAAVDRVRLLYLYPSDLTDELVGAILDTGVSYFDLSLQHVSRPLLRRMRRWGDGDRFLGRIEGIRALAPDAAFRSNFIVGYPGESEDDHDQLLEFIRAARLDWCGFFTYSEEEGTPAADQGPKVPAGLAAERLAELQELQDGITAARRDALIGERLRVLVDEEGVARSTREAPEIDGVVHVPAELPVGALVEVTVTGALGPDLYGADPGPVDPWVRPATPLATPVALSTPRGGAR